MRQCVLADIYRRSLTYNNSFTYKWGSHKTHQTSSSPLFSMNPIHLEVNTNGDGETAIDLAYRYPQLAQLLQRHVDAYGWTGSAPQGATENDGS